MVDAFISYSRRDKEFVQKLHERLAADKRNIWVDWEDIHKAADWREEINKGIADANNFVFVLSAHSAVSQECRYEIEKAVALNKRIIPLAREVLMGDDYKALHPAISAHNWIYSRDGVEEFDQIYQELVKAMDTDLEYVHQHSRLLVRAQEWETKGSGATGLLVGAEIQEAEEWLSHSQQKDPKPTDLHLQYIVASRKASTRRQRVLTGLSLAAALLTSVLAVIAIILAGQAARSAAVARSLELAANARTALDNDDLDLAIALGLEAASIDSPPQPALEILAEAAYGPGTRLEIVGQGEEITGVVVNPDRTSVLASGDGGSLILWNLDDGSQRWTSPAQPEGVVAALVITADGTRALSSFVVDIDAETIPPEAGAIAIWNMANGERTGTLLGQGQPVLALALGGEPNTLLAAYGDGIVIEWNITDASELRRWTTLEDETAVFAAAAFSADGAQVAFSWTVGDGEEGIVGLWTLSSDAVQAGDTFTETTSVPLMRFAPDSTVLAYTLAADRRLFVRSLDDLATAPRILEGPGDRITAIAFWSARNDVLAGSANNLFYIWDLATGVLQDTLQGHEDDVLTLDVLGGTSQVVTGSSDQTIRVWDLVNEDDRARLTVIPTGRNVFGVGFNLDETLALGGGSGGTLAIWTLETGDVRTRTDYARNVNVNNLIVNPVSGMILSAAGDYIPPRYWSLDNSETLVEFVGHEEWITDAAISADGSLAFTSDRGGEILVWDLTGMTDDGTVRQIEPMERYAIPEAADGVNAFAVSDDNRLIMAGSFDGYIIRIDRSAATDQQVSVYYEPPLNARIRGIDISPDGRWLAASGQFEDEIVVIWSLETNERRNLWGHADTITDVTFTANSTQILSASYDRTVRLWEVSSGRELGRLNTGAQIQRMAVKRDNAGVLMGSRTGELLYWSFPQPLNASELLDWVRANRLVRDFTCLETFAYRIETQNSRCDVR